MVEKFLWDTVASPSGGWLGVAVGQKGSDLLRKACCGLRGNDHSLEPVGTCNHDGLQKVIATATLLCLPTLATLIWNYAEKRILGNRVSADPNQHSTKLSYAVLAA